MYQLTAIREALQASVKELKENYWLYVRKPGTDFSGTHGKIGFERLIWLLLEIGGGTLRSELLEFYNYSGDTPTPSALVEARHKLLADAFAFIFYDMNERFPMGADTYKGLQIAAYDGSYLPIAPDENDQLTYVEKNDNSKPYALIRLNGFFNVLAERYMDVIIQPMRGPSEGKCLIETIERYHGPKNLVIALDRFYEIWNVIGHLMEAHLYFVIRAKGPMNPGGIVRGLSVPKDGVYDETVHVALTHSHAKNARMMEGYKYINQETVFDFIDRDHPVYEMDLRVVRIMLSSGEIETLLTNLPADDYSAADVEYIYKKRRGIEEGWAHLKYDEGMMEEHSKTPEFILQEIWARLVMYNFDSLVFHNLDPIEREICDTELPHPKAMADPLSAVSSPVTSEPSAKSAIAADFGSSDRAAPSEASASSGAHDPKSVPSGGQCYKYPYRYNVAVGVLLSHAFLAERLDESTFRHLMKQAVLPVRPGYGTHSRRKRQKTFISFRYRMIA